jgi:hypothetical protein
MAHVPEAFRQTNVFIDYVFDRLLREIHVINYAQAPRALADSNDEYGYKKGWTTEVSKFKNGEWSKFGSKNSKHKPITKIKLHS